MNILLINPGRKDYIVRYFLKLLEKFKAQLFLIDPDKNIPSFAVSKKTKNFISPKAKAKNYKFYLRKFIEKKKIKIIFPFSEFELKILSKDTSSHALFLFCTFILLFILICKYIFKCKLIIKYVL